MSEITGKYDELQSLVMKRKTSRKEAKAIIKGIEQVIADLERPEPEEDPYILLHILCYTDPTEYKQRLVERYLEGPDDSAVSSALWVLCSCWNLSPQYVDQILAFMQGVSWDEFEDCQGMAIICAGLHLKRHPAPELLRKVIEILEDESKDERLRSTAYRQLVDVTGGDIYKLPPAARRFNPETDIDPAVVKRAKERLAREEATIATLPINNGI